MQVNTTRRELVYDRIRSIQKSVITRGVQVKSIENYDFILNYSEKHITKKYRTKFLLLGSILTTLLFAILKVDELLSSRCLLPSHYIVWEASRPLADCGYCVNVSEPIILRNITRQKFAKYAYSSKPIIVKEAIQHWKAVKEFTFDTFKKLYEETAGSYESLDEGCQFLNFKSDLFSLKEVFSMPRERAKGEANPWYVGWGNCHEDILRKLRKYYDIPEFLPEDAEYPATENIFMGYEIGAVMHLDYIERLMWQGQVKGKKMWSVAPVPECEYLCHKFSFYVEQMDIVFLDTRIWYHETKIPKGQFSITVQSEYG